MRPRRAFTLLELLIVVGIIAVLIAILLPTLNRAREHARRVQCLSNLRQLAMAVSMYTNNNRGYFPAPSADPTAPESNDPDAPPPPTPPWNRDDWIYWQDPVNRNPNESALVQYLDGQRFNPELYRCPSDIIENHIDWPNTGRYEYSYSINHFISRKDRSKQIKITQVRKPWQKILFIDEAADTIDDGNWAPEHWFTIGDNRNLLSNRHERAKEDINDKTIQRFKKGRGNVAFVDGHADFIERSSSQESGYYDPFF